VLAQGAQAQFAAAQLTPQIPLHAGEVIAPGGHMEGIDHHLGGLIRRQSRQQLSPQLPPVLTGEDVVLQLGAQQGSGLTAQALDHMAEIDAPPWPALASAPVQPRQGFEVVAAQEQIQPVMVQMHRQLLADQP
jgi:hypothetical protein